MSRNKGKAGERACAAEMGALLGISDCRRGVQYCGGNDSPDVILPGTRLHVECKRTETLSLYTAMAQAVADAPASSVPMIWHRRSHKKSLIVIESARLVEFARAVIDAVEGSVIRNDYHIPENGNWVLAAPNVGSELGSTVLAQRPNNH